MAAVDGMFKYMVRIWASQCPSSRLCVCSERGSGEQQRSLASWWPRVLSSAQLNCVRPGLVASLGALYPSATKSPV